MGYRKERPRTRNGKTTPPVKVPGIPYAMKVTREESMVKEIHIIVLIVISSVLLFAAILSHCNC